MFNELSALAEYWQVLKKDNPELRARNAAYVLGVSELELLMTRPESEVLRLKHQPNHVLPRLEALGQVSALTRNNGVIMQKTGQYRDFSIDGCVGIAGGEIDLRVSLESLAYSLAVTENTADGQILSLQFFDAHGESVHKVYLTDQSDFDAYRKLIDEFTPANQDRNVQVQDKLVTPDPVIDLDVAAFRQAWLDVQNGEQFSGLLNQYNLSRQLAYQLVDNYLAHGLDPVAFEAVFYGAAMRKLPVRMTVGSFAVVQEHDSVIKVLKRSGRWFNATQPGFSLRTDTTQIGSVWVVRKPSGNGTSISVELLDQNGELLLELNSNGAGASASQSEWDAMITTLESRYSLVGKNIVA